MPTITKKQLEEYEQLRRDRDNGLLLTPDGLRFICEANDLDPEAIGKHILEVYGKFKALHLIWIALDSWNNLKIILTKLAGKCNILYSPRRKR